MESEKNLFDWLHWPLLLIIIVTPVRFGLEVEGVPLHITRYFSSTVFVFILAVYLGIAMAGRLRLSFLKLIGAGLALGYVNGFMTLIATGISTYTSLDTHYRNHSINMTDAQHVFFVHVVRLPLIISSGVCFVLVTTFYAARAIKQRHKRAKTPVRDNT